MPSETTSNTVNKNVQITETATDIIIRVQKDGDFGLSSTGKSRVIASTSGFLRLACGIAVNLTAIKPVDK